MKKIALHWQILIGIVAGILFGIAFSMAGLNDFVKLWIKPFGTIFINLLKLIAIPLIIASLIKGVSDLQDIKKFSSMGLRTLVLYIGTTVVAVSIGLLIVNIVQPGSKISQETLTQITSAYGNDASTKVDAAVNRAKTGPLQFLVDMVPDNIFNAASSNGNMLQVIFFSVFFGISLLLIKERDAKPIKDFFNGINEVIMKMVDLIMLFAPFAVFALIASLINEISNPDIFIALGYYVICVILGLMLVLVFYSSVLYFYVGFSPKKFFKAIAPAQLLAFSTSSSAATLPVTMERVTEHLGVDEEVTSFVCPVGATINMDGTSLYQAVAAVFICEALGFPLTFGDQLTIILTATLASIGSAAVPGAGMVMLVIVLEALGIPADKLAIGLAIIFAVDRPLDMCRTIINVTGDCFVATVIAKKYNKLGVPKEKNWDDNYSQV